MMYKSEVVSCDVEKREIQRFSSEMSGTLKRGLFDGISHEKMNLNKRFREEKS